MLSVMSVRVLYLASIAMSCAVFLGACNTTGPNKSVTARALPSELEGLRVDTRDLQGDEELYKVIVAELAGQRGKIDVALQNYMDLALSLDDPQLAERGRQNCCVCARRCRCADRFAALARA